MKFFPHHDNLNSVIKHFTPNWFAVNMGTGITALCLGSLPWQNFLIYSFAMGLWMLNTVLFTLFFLIWITNLLMYSADQLQLLKHDFLPFFLGCLPMAFTTVINGLVIFGESLFSNDAIVIAYYLWYMNALMSLVVVLILPYFMFIHHRHKLESMTAVWLLPFVAAEVSASSAGLIGTHLPWPDALPLLIAGYMLWGISLPLAFALIVIFLQRLLFHKLPPSTLGATVWLPLGPIATGALGLLTLGNAASRMLQNGANIFWLQDLESFGILGAIILIGFSTWIAITALVITLYYRKSGITYNMSFWSFTFPLGVYALAILMLGKATNMPIFAYFGALLTFTLTWVWIVVAKRTLPGLINGHLINNPLL